FADAARARAVGAGWDGDRLVALTKGDAIGLLWMSSWDTEADAVEFERAYREIQRRKFGAADKAEARPAAAVGSQPSYLERRGTRLTQAASRSSTSAVATSSASSREPAVLSATTVSRPLPLALRGRRRTRAAPPRFVGVRVVMPFRAARRSQASSRRAAHNRP